MDHDNRDAYVPPEPKTDKESYKFKLDVRFLVSKFLFPHLKNRGKREYAGILIRRISTYLAISYAVSIFFGVVLYYLDNLSVISGTIWNPEEILYLPFLFPFMTQEVDALITSYILTVFVPFLIAATICALIWRDEARDLVLMSSFITFGLFIALHISQVIFFTTLATSIAVNISDIWYVAFIFLFALSFMIISALGGSIGVRIGKLITNLFFSKKGAKISYSHLLNPEMPLSVRTIFDLDKPAPGSTRQHSAISMVYLHNRVVKLLKSSQKKHCTYFTEGKCAYLGYVTSVHKYQICVTDYWPLCKIYAFLSQSKFILKESSVGEKDSKQN
ncbi:MAG: hypothetical protein GOP50_06000 [Candidatus Heimdallarchaeota archaeon]|nr:hypothetical protein [Candidatus Heimdallarchaeota archaeon]